jgi:hypothetical protein
MSAAARLLSQLTNVRQTAPGRWIASCPTAAHRHGDRSRGLSIREIQDRVLIYCHAGCGAGEIVEALGLTLGDLYDRSLTREYLEQVHSPIPARDLLVILDHELTVVVLILEDIVTRRTANKAQVQRLCQAAARIGRARDMANPAKVTRHAA